MISGSLCISAVLLVCLSEKAMLKDVTAEIKSNATEGAQPATNSPWVSLLRSRRLLAAAAVFHLVITVTVSVIGHFGVLPGVFDRNGIATAVASDGTKLRAEAARRSDELTHGQIRDWFHANTPFYLKLYSVCFATIGIVFGPTVLSAEPVNSFFYLAVLILVFQLGQELFNRRTGYVVAAAVAVWPSFVLHTTQLLRDPMFIAGMLAFTLAAVRLLTRSFSWRAAILTALAGGLMATLVWLSRDTMGEVLIATAAIAGLLALVRLLAEKWRQVKSAGTKFSWRGHVPTLVGMVLLLTLSVGVTRVIPKFHRQYKNTPSIDTSQPDDWKNSRRLKRDVRLEPQTEAPADPWSRLVARIGRLRQGFTIEFSDAGSNLDPDIQINNTADVVRYLPRAAMIGYFAPFPNMWLSTGNQVGRGGRILSGVETVALYLIEALALVGLWGGRRLVAAWFLWLVSALGLISLGLVVVNVGALYRLRYVFAILLMILATEGGRRIFESFQKRKPHLASSRLE